MVPSREVKHVIVLVWGSFYSTSCTCSTDVRRLGSVGISIEHFLQEYETYEKVFFFFLFKGEFSAELLSSI